MAKLLIQWLVCAFVLQSHIDAVSLDETSGKARKISVAVIGAGPSGMASAKYAIEHGLDVTVYEQSNDLGGIWQYTDRIGKNRFGVKIHTAMYKNLRWVNFYVH